MGICGIIGDTKSKNKKISTIECIYDIKDHNLTQIINYRGEKTINEEIESKIKIFNGNIRKIDFPKKI